MVEKPVQAGVWWGRGAGCHGERLTTGGKCTDALSPAQSGFFVSKKTLHLRISPTFLNAVSFEIRLFGPAPPTEPSRSGVIPLSTGGFPVARQHRCLPIHHNPASPGLRWDEVVVAQESTHPTGQSRVSYDIPTLNRSFLQYETGCTSWLNSLAVAQAQTADQKLSCGATH